MSYELHCGDGIEYMRRLPDGAVDHVITDPPYAEQTHKGARTGDGSVALVDFDAIDDEQFVTLCQQCVRVAKRWVIMTCEWRHAAKIEGAGLPLVRLGVWIKPNGAPQFTGDRPGTGWEAVLLMHREGKKRWNGGGHHAVWTVNKIEAKFHPTQKPLPLIKKWIAQFTDVGETILDPFAGSATTGVACIQAGRDFIGIEKDAGYHAIAAKRLADAAAQPMLFPVEA